MELVKLEKNTPNLADLKNQAYEVFENLDISENTRHDYRLRIEPFLEHISKKGLGPDNFISYKKYLACRTDYTPSTKNKYLATARVFLKELSRRGFIPDITANVKAFKQTKKHKREGLTEEEISKLTEFLKNLPDTPKNVRLKAIISLLALQGLRQIEVVRLDVADLDLPNRVMFVQGKGADDKEPVSLHPEAVKHLRQYLKIIKIKDGPLFVSTSNNSKGKRLSTRYIREIVKDVLEKLDIDKTTHGFRHFFTTALIKAYKGDLLEVARYTRHKSLEMLQVYNDNIKAKEDLPRFYKTFSYVRF